jgi:hypothetical protein
MEKPRRDEQPVRGPAAGQRGRLRFAWPAARSSVCHSCSMNISAVCGETWARRTSRAAWHVELPGDAEERVPVAEGPRCRGGQGVAGVPIGQISSPCQPADEQVHLTAQAEPEGPVRNAAAGAGGGRPGPFGK